MEAEKDLKEHERMLEKNPSGKSMSECEIRSEKCSDTCQHKIKFVLAFAKSDLTLVEICTVALYFGSDICQIKL